MRYVPVAGTVHCWMPPVTVTVTPVPAYAAVHIAAVGPFAPVPPQVVNRDELAAARQMPAEHAMPAPQTRSQTPQLKGSDERSWQSPPQAVSGGVHAEVHVKSTQIRPAPQRRPQSPQLVASELRSRQTPEQLVRPSLQSG